MKSTYKFLISASLVAIMTATIVFVLQSKHDNTVPEMPESETKSNSSSERLEAQPKSISLIDDNSGSITVSGDENKSIKSEPGLVQYEDEWCSLDELTPKDRRYVQALSEDLAHNGGMGLAPFSKGDLEAFLGEHTQSLLPYAQMEKDEITSQILNHNNRQAMIIGLYRDDFERKQKYGIAQLLTSLGDYENGLSYLVADSLLKASMTYEENNDELTEETNLHLIDAMAYVEFGLDHYDSAVLHAMMQMLKSEIIPGALNPLVSLSDDDLLFSHKVAKGLEQDITEVRDSLNVGPIDKDFNNAELYRFRAAIAYFYRHHPESMRAFGEFYGNKVESLASSTECIDKLYATYTHSGNK